MSNTTQKKKILVVEDERDVLDYLTTLFIENGYETITAQDGNEGMEKVKSKKLDLITLDISMPEKSGLKFYRELTEDQENRNIPVVVITAVTGYGNRPQDFERFLSTRKQIPPPSAFFSKPFDRDELLKKVDELIS